MLSSKTALATEHEHRTPTSSSDRAPTRFTRVVLAIAVVVAVAAGRIVVTACRQGRADASARHRAVAGTSSGSQPALRHRTPAALPSELRVRVLASYPHDRRLLHPGTAVGARGALSRAPDGYGESLVRRWRPGVARPLAEERLARPLFAEGIAAVGETLIQLTWREGIAFYRDRDTLREKARRSYEGEGWGLCYDGEHLIMSDGTDLLTERDPESFLELRSRRRGRRRRRRSASSTSSSAPKARSTPTSTRPTASPASILRAAA